MIDAIPLSFFLPLVIHVLAGLTTGVTGVLAFRASTCRGRHHQWGRRYLWTYTVVFVTATVLSLQSMPADTYLLVLVKAHPPLAVPAYQPLAGASRSTSNQCQGERPEAWVEEKRASGLLSSKNPTLLHGRGPPRRNGTHPPQSAGAGLREIEDGV